MTTFRPNPRNHTVALTIHRSHGFLEVFVEEQSCKTRDCAKSLFCNKGKGTLVENNMMKCFPFSLCGTSQRTRYIIRNDVHLVVLAHLPIWHSLSPSRRRGVSTPPLSDIINHSTLTQEVKVVKHFLPSFTKEIHFRDDSYRSTPHYHISYHFDLELWTWRNEDWRWLTLLCFFIVLQEQEPVSTVSTSFRSYSLSVVQEGLREMLWKPSEALAVE